MLQSRPRTVPDRFSSYVTLLTLTILRMTRLQTAYYTRLRLAEPMTHCAPLDLWSAYYT